jgi:predicted amidohydrolase
MQVLACQFDIAWEDEAANYARVRALVDAADPQPGSLLVLPEMFATGFSMHVDSIAETVDGPTQAFLSALAAEHRCYVVAGVVTRHPDGRGRNEAVVIDPTGREIARYCKLHPFTLGGESLAFVAGNEIVVLPIGPLLVAPTICYDLRFPETYRRIAQRGAQLVLVIASWPIARVSHWRALLVARAIENQAYVVGVNRIGRDPHLAYNGQSLIVDPGGRILADAEDGERVISAELELEPLLAYRRDLPFLADIRAEDVTG